MWGSKKIVYFPSLFAVHMIERLLNSEEWRRTLTSTLKIMKMTWSRWSICEYLYFVLSYLEQSHLIRIGSPYLLQLVLFFLSWSTLMILLNAMLIDEQSYQGRVRARASPTKHWISEREFQVSMCHFAQVWKMGGSNGPIFREKVCVIFLSLFLFSWIFYLLLLF